MSPSNPSIKPRKPKLAKPPNSLSLQERRFTAEGAPPPGCVGLSPPDADTAPPAARRQKPGG